MAKHNEQLEAMLADYVDGTLGDRERAEVDRLLASNPAQRELLESMRRQRGLLQALPRESAPGDFREEVQSQLERSLLLGDEAFDPAASEMRINRWPQIRAAAAILLLVAGIIGVVYWAVPDQRHRPPELAGDFPDLPDVPADGSVDIRRDDGAPARDTATIPSDRLRGGAASNVFPTPESAAGAMTLESARAGGPPDAPAASEATPMARRAQPATAAPSANPPTLATPAGPDSREAAPLAEARAEENASAGWQPVALGAATAAETQADASVLALREPVPQIAAFADADLILLVRTDDAAVANEQVSRYFVSNGIAVTASPDPNIGREQATLYQDMGFGTLSSQSPGQAAQNAGTTMPPSEAQMVQAPAQEPEIVGRQEAAGEVPGSPAVPPAGAREADAIAAAAGEQLRRLATQGQAATPQQWFIAREVTAQQAAELSESLQSPLASRQQVQAFGRRSVLSFQSKAASDLLGAGAFDATGDPKAAVNPDAAGEAAAVEAAIAPAEVLLVTLPIGNDVREVRARVADDGRVDLPLLGRIALAGLTTTQAVDRLNAGLQEWNFGRPHAASATVCRAELPAVGRGGWGGGADAAVPPAVGDGQPHATASPTPTTQPLDAFNRRLNVVVVIESTASTQPAAMPPSSAPETPSPEVPSRELPSPEATLPAAAPPTTHPAPPPIPATRPASP